MAVRGLLGAALIGIEFDGQAAAAQPFLESLMESLGVGLQVISRIEKEMRMVVDDDTQEGREGFGAVGRVDKGRERSPTSTGQEESRSTQRLT